MLSAVMLLAQPRDAQVRVRHIVTQVMRMYWRVAALFATPSADNAALDCPTRSTTHKALVYSGLRFVRHNMVYS